MRVGIVNDMAMAVEALRRTIAAVPDFEIAWIARDGAQAVDRAAEDLPDVILMDLYMPVMDGVEATRRIMAANPCAILVVTASVEANASKVFEALGAGALDAVVTPVIPQGSLTQEGNAVVAKVRTIERLIGKRPSTGTSGNHIIVAAPMDTARQESAQVVVIGSSAGGPPALADILHQMPPDFPPVVIIQHIDAEFAPGMAQWLKVHSPFPVHLAREGEILEPGNIYIAASHEHLIFTGPSSLGYTSAGNNSFYRPCIDVCFFSLLKHLKGRVAAAILTGMGRDGAAGLKALREAGCFTIAQNQETSVVYGMPKAAAEMDAADKVLPLNQIVPAMSNYFVRTQNSV